MSEAGSTIPAPRARPVAELPVDALLSQSQELARRWAVALILQRCPQDIGAVPLEELARDAPALCGQAVRALQSEAELDRLAGGAAGRGRGEGSAAGILARIAGAAGAGGPGSASVAGELVSVVEALRGVLWEALLEHLGLAPTTAAGSRALLDAGDRLAYVCSRLLGAALGAQAGASPHEGGEGSPSRPREAARPQGAATGGAVLVDERSEEARGASSPSREQAGASSRPKPRGASARRGPAQERPVLHDEAPPPRRSAGRPWTGARSSAAGRRRGESSTGGDAPRAGGEQIEIRDARGEQGPAAWIDSIGRQLERMREDGLPFAVLLVEPPELELLRRQGPAAEMLRLADEVEDALAVALRLVPHREPGERRGGPGGPPWSDSLTRERPGRYWLLAPETDRAGAERLAERLRRAVASLVQHRGAPVEVLIGAASCPRDGSDAATLAAHADLELYAARAGRSRNPSGAAPIDGAA